MSIALACVLTVLIETPFLALCGYRRTSELAIIASVNVITNLVMNLTLAMMFRGWNGPILLVAEAAVVAVEYGVYAFAFGRSRRLFLQTLSANALSCGIGLVMLCLSR